MIDLCLLEEGDRSSKADKVRFNGNIVVGKLFLKAEKNNEAQIETNSNEIEKRKRKREREWDRERDEEEKE